MTLFPLAALPFPNMLIHLTHCIHSTPNFASEYSANSRISSREVRHSWSDNNIQLEGTLQMFYEGLTFFCFCVLYKRIRKNTVSEYVQVVKVKVGMLE